MQAPTVPKLDPSDMLSSCGETTLCIVNSPPHSAKRKSSDIDGEGELKEDLRMTDNKQFKDLDRDDREAGDSDKPMSSTFSLTYQGQATC
jgi:hypothetical protein